MKPPPTRRPQPLLTIVARLALVSALPFALASCVSPETDASAAAGADRRAFSTYTGRIDIGVYLGLRGQPGEPLYSVSILLDAPSADGWRKVELDAYYKSELRVGQSTLRSGDRISFEGYADELFRRDRRIPMSALKNIRIIERAPTPEPQPGPAAKPTSPEKAKDGSKEPWAPPSGFGPQPDKAKPAESPH